MSSTGQHSDQYWFITRAVLVNTATSTSSFFTLVIISLKAPYKSISLTHKEAPELTTQTLPLKPLGYLNICLNFAVSYEYTRGHYAGEAHQSGPRVVREAGVNPAQYPLL